MAAPAPKTSQGGAPYLLPSASHRSDGSQRFTLALDPALATSDHGLRFLIQQETRFDGFERATREVIDAHLKSGDLFIDVGAHVGTISLSAATLNDNPVLAIEPAPDNLRQLAASIAANGMDQRITVVPAAVGAASGKSRLRLTRGSMGYRLAADDAGAAVLDGAIDVDVFSLDDLLARFPQYDQRRVVLKIDVEGQEAAVLAGARKLLASGRLRLIIWEKFAMAPVALDSLLANLARHHFASFMFAFHDWGGPLIPFVNSPAIGNVFSFAAGERRLPGYPRDFARRPPHDVAHAMPPAQEHLLAYIEALRQAGGSDGSRWSNWQALEPGSVERAEAASPFVPPGAHLLDLGAGRMELRRRMPPGARYQPADLVAWSADCQTVDLNYGPFPAKDSLGGHYEVVAALGLLEYLRDPAALIAAARSAAYRLIVTYPTTDSRLPVLARRGYGWMNDIDLAGSNRCWSAPAGASPIAGRCSIPSSGFARPGQHEWIRMNGEALCRLDEIRDPGSKGFERDDGSIFLIRRGGEVTGYVNSCPHTGGPLDWVEGQFLDHSGQYIVCATHGALFRPGDGHCIAGPCAGDRLKPVALTLRDGVVYLES